MKVLFTGLNGSLGKTYHEQFPDTQGVSVRHGDNDSITRFGKALETTDVLIHAAANVHAPTYEEAFKDNLHLTLELLDEVKRVNDKMRVVLVSSMSMLGRDGNIKPMYKMMPYSLSKYLMEELSKKYDLPITIARFSTLFYRDPNKDGLSKIITNAKTQGKVSVIHCQRDFIPLDIAAQYLYRIAKNSETVGKTYNLASGEPHSLVEIAHYLQEKYNTAVEVKETTGSDDICYEFSKQELAPLGLIDFDLFEQIDHYYESV